MTKKFYRLADKGDINIEVEYTDDINDFIPGHKRKLLDIDYNSSSYEGDYVFETDRYRFAVIEITPADFTDEQIKAEYDKRFNKELEPENEIEWVDAEWPRDAGKDCRAYYYPSFKFGKIIAVLEDKNFFVEYQEKNESKLSAFKDCQVRADSVFGKKMLCLVCKKPVEKNGKLIPGFVIPIKIITPSYKGVEIYCSEACKESTLYREPINGQDRFKKCEYKYDWSDWYKGIFLSKNEEHNSYRILDLDDDSGFAFKCRIRKDA